MSANSLAVIDASPKTIEAQPSFWRALRGVWLFTWKSQFTWRRLGLGGLALLALPVLVYLTTSSPGAWAQGNRLKMGNPAAFLNGYSRRAARAGVPLQPAQVAELTRILREVYQQVGRDSASTPEALAESPREQLDKGYAETLRRVRPVLDERQFIEFQNYQRRQRSQLNVPAGEPVWNRTTPFYRCLIDLYFFIILPLNCVRTCGALIRDELEANTLSFLTTRPLSRAQLLVIKFLTQTVWLQFWFAAQTLLVFAAGGLRQVPDLGGLAGLFLGAQVLAVVAWSALGLLLGQISKRYMALALVYGLIVEMGIGRIPTNINTLSMMRHLKGLLGHNPALQSVFHWPVLSIPGPVSALVLAAALFVVLATLLFTWLEYHHTTEMQK